MAYLPSLDESFDKIVNTKTVRAPAASVELGGQPDFPFIRGVQSLEDSGPGVGVKNLIDGKTYTIGQAEINDDETFPGILPTLVPEGNAFRFGLFGGDDSETKTVSGDEKITVLFTQVFTAVQTVHKWRGTEGLMHYRFSDTTTFDGEPTFVYTSEDGDPIDFDNPTDPLTGEVTYDTLHPQYLIKDHVMLVEWFSADGNPMTMKGQTIGGIFVPYFDTSYCDVLFKQLATEQYVSEFYASAGFTAGTTATVLADTVTPVKVAGTYIAGNLKNFSHVSGVLTVEQETTDGYITNIPRAILNVRATCSLTLERAIETDVIQIGVYKNGVLVPGTAVTKTLSAVFGGVSTSPEFEMYGTIIDSTEADDFDVRILNTSNATNIVATDCKLQVSF